MHSTAIRTMTPASSNDIQQWLLYRLGEYLGIELHSISTDRPLMEYGLDSKGALQIIGEMECWMECEIDPIVIWDYPTIEKMSQHLFEFQSAA